MTVRRLAALLAVCQALFAFALLAGCKSCGSAAPLAQLVAVHGVASRDFAGHVGSWTPASLGAGFAVETASARTHSTAQLRLRGGGSLDVRPDTVLRFLASAPSARGAREPRDGHRGDSDGLRGARVRDALRHGQDRPGARVRLTDDGKLTRFDVIVGSAIVETEDASAASLGAGQSLDWSARRAATLGAPAVLEAGAPIEAAADDPDTIGAEVLAPGVRRASSRSSPLLPLDPGSVRLEPGSRLVVPDGVKIVVHRGSERATVSGAADSSWVARPAPCSRPRTDASRSTRRRPSFA